MGQKERGVDEEAIPDPRVAEFMATTSATIAARAGTTNEERRAFSRGPVPPVPSDKEFHRVTDEILDGIPIRFYEQATDPTGLIVYFHGGGWVVGSVGFMDNMARELAYASGANLVSVEYRLAPEHPYPAPLDDCENATRAVLRDLSRFGGESLPVAVAGESAGGNLAAAVALRLRDAGEMFLAAQVLIYAALDHRGDYPSRKSFRNVFAAEAAPSGAESARRGWGVYGGGPDIDTDPYYSPMLADNLSGMPATLVVGAGMDFFRDEGRVFAERLRQAGVEAEDVCWAGQPHGFMNLLMPASADAYAQIGSWLRATFARASAGLC